MSHKLISRLLSGLILTPLVVSGIGYFQTSAIEQQYNAETSLNNILDNMNYYAKRDFLNVLHTAMDIASNPVEPLKLNSIPFYDRLKAYVTGKDDRYVPLYIITDARYNNVEAHVRNFCSEVSDNLYHADLKTVSSTVNRILKEKTPMDTRIVLTNPNTLFYLDNNQEARYPYSEPDEPYNVPSSYNSECPICGESLHPDPDAIYNNPNRRLITLCCHHTSHSECYQPWLIQNATHKCPMCVQDHKCDSTIHLSYDVQMIKK